VLAQRQIAQVEAESLLDIRLFAFHNSMNYFLDPPRVLRGGYQSIEEKGLAFGQ
jgi:hypothetical protein